MSAATGNTNGRAQNRTHRNKRRTQTLSRSPLNVENAAGGGRGLCAARERSERAGAGLLIKVATSGTFQLLAGGGKERAARCVFHLSCPGAAVHRHLAAAAAPATQTKEGNLVAPLFPSAWIIHSQVRVPA